MSVTRALITVATVLAIQSGPTTATCCCKYLPQLGLPLPLPLPPPPLLLPAALPVLPSCGASCCGPPPTPLPVIQAPPINFPPCQGPVIPLPSPPIPPPTTIAHKCVCTKTVVKPQIIQRCISVPSIQTYLKRSFTPVIENIAYKANPKCSPPCTACAACAACAAPPPCGC